MQFVSLNERWFCGEEESTTGYTWFGVGSGLSVTEVLSSWFWLIDDDDDSDDDDDDDDNDAFDWFFLWKNKTGCIETLTKGKVGRACVEFFVLRYSSAKFLGPLSLSFQCVRIQIN